MKIALVQTKLQWENCDKNLEHIYQLIRNISGADIIILPEMFTSGFTMNVSAVSQKMNEKGVEWLQKMAHKKSAIFVASLVIKDNGSIYNRLVWVFPNGKIKTYDKKHLFRMASEHKYFSPGRSRLFVTYKDLRFCPQICYDLRFPIWSRNSDGKSTNPVYDCLIYVANWPTIRRDAWLTLLKARAIENQAYVIGVNRVGKDEKGINYSGDSRVFSPKGERLDSIISGKEMVDIVEINIGELNDFREKFPVSDDADFFEF